MKLNRKLTMFGRHETFPLRYAWLTKGLEVLRKQPGIFANPERAMVELGVGANMVRAIQYWLQVTGVAKFADGRGAATDLGDVLLGPNGDPYLEDEATLWVIHWLIASSAELATGFPRGAYRGGPPLLLNTDRIMPVGRSARLRGVTGVKPQLPRRLPRRIDPPAQELHR